MTPVSPQSGNFRTAIFFGCSLSLLLCSSFEPRAQDNLRLAQAPGEAETLSEGWGKSKKAKTKWKAAKAKQYPQKAQKSESQTIMKTGGGKGCPPGQTPLGSARRGGCQ